MEIILHIGPHKTGTTPIQEYMCGRFGKGEDGIWYPPPLSSGPGHALLAWATLGIRENIPVDESLKRLVYDASSRGIERLILSSEEFSFAQFNGIENLANSISGHPVHLVCTLTPLDRRIPSLWQEEIKHGASYTQADVPNFTINSPGLQPRFVSQFVQQLEPDQTSILLIGAKDAPALLLNRMCQLLGKSFDDDFEKLNRNSSLGLVEVELLRALNIQVQARATDFTRAQLMREALMGFFNSDDWRSKSERIPITIEHSIQSLIERLTEGFAEELEELRKQPNVEIYGSFV